MLVLSRHRDESIYINDDIIVTIVDIRGDRVRLGIQAPANTSIHREEVWKSIRQETLDRQQKDNTTTGSHTKDT
jgi:carbon storage regulator